MGHTRSRYRVVVLPSQDRNRVMGHDHDRQRALSRSLLTSFQLLAVNFSAVILGH